MKRTVFVAAVIAAIGAVFTATAGATPVATSDEQYTVLGRVFPDPLAGCQNAPAGSPCSPNAKGNFPATQFIQFTNEEFIGALRYMNTEWSNNMEVWALDGKVGEGEADDPAPAEVFEGNSLPLEFEPDPDFKSAGLPTSRLERDRSDLIVVRVTDESVPDDQKKRYALSLSIHGIERAGAEGGTRALEDLVTAGTTGLADDPVLPADVVEGAPTFEEVLKKTIIYFTYPNPDGWRRGTVFDTDLDKGPGVFFQRYNGNGVDPNRDWPDIGYSFRGYSGLSEPETKAFASFYDDLRDGGAEFAAGDDLHGMAGADALSYTMLPHGRHDFAKDYRLRKTAETIHKVSEQVLGWSPAIQPNDADPPQCVPAAVTEECAPIYGQTWGTVYDTINYTTTGTLGDWFDSKAGLNADGIDNEMAFSHIDKNVVFDPHTEQLHVDGNKALIYAHIAELLDPPAARLEAEGQKGFVPNERLTREEKANQSDDTGFAQPSMEIPSTPQTGTRTVIPFPETVQPGNGGMRVEVTLANAQGVAPSYTPIVNANRVRLSVECKGCDDHHGPADAANPEWVVVAEDYNQAQLYMAAGLIATVNRPEGSTDSQPVEWRLVVSAVHGAVKGKITFTPGPASADGNSTNSSSGDEPPKLAGYDVANTDFFDDLEEFDASDSEYTRVDPRAVITGSQSLSALDTLVLADDPLPGYTGSYGGARPSTPREPIEIEGEPTAPDAYGFEGVQFRIPGVTATQADFQIAPTEAFRRVKVRIDWTSATDPAVHDSSYDNDFDMFLYRVQGDQEILVGQSTGFGGETNWEEIVLEDPLPGSYRVYVDNWAAADYRWTGTVTFEHYEGSEDGGSTDTGAYTRAEKDAWLGYLREFAAAGGNLVLTDGALRALPDLAGLPPGAVSTRPVYVGQVSFSDGESDTTDPEEHPLSAGVEQPGARFNTGMRRQTYESTPLGFAIQSDTGGDQANAVQWDVDREAWETAGGRYDGGSVDSGTRDAAAVYHRVALGEMPVGKGRIRIAGALLPQPSNEFDHPLGVEPYALTYTGYILAGNLLDWKNPEPPPPPPTCEDPKKGNPGKSKGHDKNHC